MNAIAQAIEIVGNASRLARILNVSVQAVCFWRDGKRSVPANRCLAIERATGGLVKRGDLRADAHLIWPDVASPISDPPHPGENPNTYRPPVSAGKEANSHV